MNDEIPLINVPYPIELTVEEVLSRRSEEKLKSRGPNRYFIYRLAYLKELRKRIGESIISMTKLSPNISMSWSNEPPEVKEAYKGLAEQVENRLKELRQSNDLIIIHENFSSASPSTTNNDYTVDGQTFVYPYYYDYNFFYYDYYSYYYFY
ncbi:hypothetical protein RclHR1_06450005 [Rhizophagus clarus]|uniref:Kinase-like domain-containing protein n=1 Tax=Rhizophagus clarus TaxID=94130 RepID=A0A2Z6SIK9_9GLOM|nr:hypothetical protein RclHR1_06450005 [Rhizophagus clarus]GES90103.1 kinase-like domain-containing protein [Rhizophagus clarus]